MLDKIAGRQVLVGISSGKDSAATSLHLTELGIEHMRVFENTGIEHQVSLDYLRGPLTQKLGPIVEIQAQVPIDAEERARLERAIADLPLVQAAYERGAPFVLYALKKAMFPHGNGRGRWCTDLLKTEPLKRLIEDLSDGGREVVSVAGIRAAESTERAQYSEWEELRWGRIKNRRRVEYDCEVWRPILAWTLDDVIAIHRRHGLTPNPLYHIPGIERIGCFCIRSRKAEIRATAERMPEVIDFVREMETAVRRLNAARMDGEAIRNPNWRPPGWFQAPLGGNGSCWSIDDVVAWSRTSHGGKQVELFAPTTAEGCSRWGLCEAAPVPLRVSIALRQAGGKAA